MKILMTADTVGGVWTYCMDLCRTLQRYGAQVYLVTMGERVKDWQWKEALELENVVIYETCFQLEWMQDPWDDIDECGDWLLQLEEDLQPDIVHLNCFAYGALPFKAPVLTVAHSDVWSWFLSVKEEEPSAEWKPYFHCVQNGLLGAGKVVAPSFTMLRFLEEIYGIKGEAIYNGRGTSLFYVGEK
ncbi:MAG: glycosyltransferase family 4 protein, partial [Bacteroidota bacterium]|nr:glycosyltransferase family 4 protein [Bacteroidota bacterium]